jgi:FixJ family two-component response regulator
MQSLVHVVDDDVAFRTALIRVLRGAGYEVRAYASVAEVLLEANLDAPGCFILDVHMPGPSGLELQAALARRNDPPPVIFISGYLDVPTTVAAMKRGAVDFLAKPVNASELIAAVQNALAVDTAARATRARDRLSRVRFESLSERDRDLLNRVTAGQLNREIAQQMGIAERTVKLHRARIMETLGARTLPDLVRISDRLCQTSGRAH